MKILLDFGGFKTLFQHIVGDLSVLVVKSYPIYNMTTGEVERLFGFGKVFSETDCFNFLSVVIDESIRATILSTTSYVRIMATFMTRGSKWVG